MSCKGQRKLATRPHAGGASGGRPSRIKRDRINAANSSNVLTVISWKGGQQGTSQNIKE